MLVSESVVAIGAIQLRVTISVGGILLAPGDTAESLIGRADELLYRAKAAGRNRSLIG